MIRLVIKFWFIVLPGIPTLAQDIPVDTWRTHFSYQEARKLSVSESKIFCAVKNSLFSLDLDDLSTTKITKVTGLSDVSITAMQYRDGVLALGYETGIIDLITDQKIISIRDFADLNEEVEKTIYDLVVDGQKIYAASSIGVLVIDLEEEAITDNYRSIGDFATDISVVELLLVDDVLFAITSEGIQFGSVSTNLLDFNNWRRIGSGLSLRSLTHVQDTLYVLAGTSQILQLVEGQLQDYSTSELGLVNLKAQHDQLYVNTKNGLYLVKHDEYTTIIASSEMSINDFEFIDDHWWFADANSGLTNQLGVSFVPNGPQSDEMTGLSLVGNDLYTVYGPKAGNYEGTIDSLGYDRYDYLSGHWKKESIDGFFNITDVVRFQGNLYFASAGMGLYNATLGTRMDDSNSILRQNRNNSGVVIADLEAFNSLYVVSYNNEYPLIELTSSGEWQEFDAGLLGTHFPIAAKISNLDVLWVSHMNSGITTIYTPDVRTRLINTASNLPSNSVNKVEITVDDEAWVATEQGIVSFSEGSFIFNDQIIGTELIYNNAELYISSSVSCVASDGGGRIWVAGLDHLSVYDRSFSRRDYFFTTRNSPLPSGNVIAMEYNESNGEMYILTEKGLCSFRSNSSSQNSSHRNVEIFPNPVRPDYTGVVGIRGVVTDAVIKITDINGRLVNELEANGGTASWNRLDFRGRPVPTGVYLLFSSSKNGDETYVGKLAVVAP